METILGTIPGTLDEPNPLMRIPDVIKATGLGRTTIYEMMKRGDFPMASKPNPRVTVWWSSQITEFMARCPVVYPTSEKQNG